MSIETRRQELHHTHLTNSKLSFSFNSQIQSNHIETNNPETKNIPQVYDVHRFREDLDLIMGDDRLIRKDAKMRIRSIVEVATTIDNIPTPPNFFDCLTQSADGTIRYISPDIPLEDGMTQEIYGGYKQMIAEVYKIKNVKERNNIRDLIDNTRNDFIAQHTKIDYGNYNGVTSKPKDAPTNEQSGNSDPSVHRQYMWD